MKKIKIISLVAVVFVVATTVFLRTSEKKSIEKFYIKFYDKKFSVSKEVLNQFGALEGEKEFMETQQRLPEEEEKEIEYFPSETLPGKVVGVLAKRFLKRTNIWDITPYVESLISSIKDSDEEKEIFSKVFDVLLGIAAGKIEPEEIKDLDTLFMIIKIADKLGNDHVMRLCAGPLMKKITGVKEIRPIHTFEGRAGSVYKVVLLPGEKQFLSGADDGTVKLWSLENLEGKRGLIHTFAGSTGQIYEVVLVPGRGQFLSHSRGGGIELWSLKGQRELLHTFMGHPGRLFKVVLVSGEKQFLSWSDDRTIKLWDLEGQRELLHTFVGHAREVRGVVLLPGEKKFLSWSDDRTIKLWDLEGQRELLHTFVGHAREVREVVLLPGEKQFLSWSDDRTIKLWDLEEQRELLHTFEAHAVDGVVLLPRKRQFLSGAVSDRAIELWDLEGQRELIHTFVGHAGRSRGFFLLSGENQFLSVEEGGAIELWDIEGQRELLHTFAGHVGEVNGVDLLPGDGQFLSWSQGGTIKLWNLEGQKGLVYTFAGHFDWINGVVLLPGARQFLSWSSDETIKLWDLDPFDLTFQQIEFCYDLFERKIEMSLEEGTPEYETLQSLPEFLRNEIARKRRSWWKLW